MRRTPSSSMAGRSSTRAGTTALSISARSAVPGAGSSSSSSERRSRGSELSSGQGVAAREDEDEVLVEEVGGQDLVAAEGKGHHGQVELARGELLLQGDAGAVGHVEVDVGVAHPQQVEELGHQPAAGGADHAQADRAHDLLPQGGDVGHHRLELVGDPAGPLDDHLTFLGEAARGPVDQLHVELALQPGHVGRYVGLDGADGGGRGREAAGVGDAQQCLQVFQFHPGSPVEKCSRQFCYPSV